jgi:hypothetical protein
VTTSYNDFLRAKVKFDEGRGLPCEPSEVNPWCKPHQRAIVAWAVRGGQRAIFAAFGLGKSVMQLEVLRLTIAKSGGGMGLVIAPLGVRQEFKHDAAKIGLDIQFVRTDAEAQADGLYVTNYESVREGKINPARFKAVSLDEASILRGFGGTKTFREFMATIAGDDRRDQANRIAGEGVKYRFVATATPSPNEYIELLAYAAFLGVMDVGQAKTRFFKRNSEKADELTIHAHKEKEFWLWVSSWGIFVQSPADLGFDATGYALPPLEVRWHEVKTDHANAGHDRDGQGKLLRDTAIGLQDASREKRRSMADRIAKMVEIVREPSLQEIIPGVPKDAQQWVAWCDLNDEQNAAQAALEKEGLTVSSVAGAQPLDEREDLLEQWRDRKKDVLLSKPVLLGSGVNLQQCNRAIFLGIGFKFNDMIQAVHRVQRFGQANPVRIDFIYTEAERAVKATLMRKWKQHNTLVENMTKIIQEYGLSNAAMANELTRSLGLERREESGANWTAVNNDTVDETARMKADSVGLVLTSVPFATQYEYSPSYNDFGHTDDVPHFFKQMDFLTPNLLRVLMPGRILAVHVKDRITPGSLTGLGFQTVAPFHADCINHYIKHGFGYLGMKTIVTDVVRENAQTYRLGWSEQCKDGSRMGVGMPEYLLLFRKPPTDRSQGYADVRVAKSKQAYTRSRWQFDAHGFARSSGDRLLMPADLRGLSSSDVFKVFRKHSSTAVYDFEHDVKLAEELDRLNMLPPGFMLCQPVSHSEDVWTDVTRMRTLNGEQAAKGKEMHLCPLQFDIVDRAIVQYTNPGDEVYDPFGGLMTVPLRAVKLGRRGRGVELNPAYFTDGTWHLKRHDTQANSPTLFDMTEKSEEAALTDGALL